MSPAVAHRLAARVAAACLAVASLAGCPRPRIPQPPDALTDAEAVLQLATARLSPIQSVSVEARASYYADGVARKGKVIVLARRPASLHFSTLSPTDDLLGVLASDGERFMSFERGGEECYVGRACPENVGRMLPLVMEPAAVVDVLLGGAPVIAHHDESVSWDASAGAYRVELQGEGGLVERLWIRHGTGAVQRAELRRAGELELRLTFSDFAPAGEHELPRTLQFEMPRGGVDLKIKYRDVDVNTEIADDAFSIPCPAGTVEHPLACHDDPPPAAP